jgi:lipoate-protein ligase A
MSHDREALLSPLSHPIFRAYIWQTPGITYPENKIQDPLFEGFDHAPRPSGGGIVFHSPNDLVFSCIGTLSDPHFPTKFKEKLSWMTQIFKDALTHFGIEVDKPTICTSNYHPFCSAYESPYELTINGNKILGLSAKKLKNQWIIQGILHLNNTHEAFYQLPESYHAHFLKDVSIGLSAHSIISYLLRPI